jgi:hypothetical protein
MAGKKRSAWGGARPGAGRPATFTDYADRTIRFKRADLEALEALAEKNGTTTAEEVRKAVRAYLTRRRS